jgi:hypothetical protein
MESRHENATSFQNVHRSEALVVCGCGESLNALAGPERFVTVGVNDVGRLFTPRYLVVVNPRNQFAGDRASSIVRCTGRELASTRRLSLARASAQALSSRAHGLKAVAGRSALPR